MKYTKHIVFFLFINLVVVFLSIFTGNLTRKLELSNNEIKQNIERYNEQLLINKLEYSFYNNSDYIKKLHSIYFSLEEQGLEKKIVSFSNILNFDNESVMMVNLKSK